MATTGEVFLGKDTVKVTQYPVAWQFDGLLTSGEAVCVRPIRPEDAPLLIRFHAGLSQMTIYRRFFDAHPVLSLPEAAHFAEVDYCTRMAFVAEVSGEIVAVARYDRIAASGGEAEVAFVVADAFQRHGVGTLLLESLAAYAWASGIGRFVAEVESDNVAMLAVFVTSGLRCSRTLFDGTVRAEIDLRPTAAYRQRCEAREATAESASVARFLRPQSVAVVGAGRRPGSVGHEVVRSLLAGDFSGTVYPVNPSARSICGVPCYPSLAALPERVDLAVVAVPPAAVPAVLEQAAAAGVRAVTVITAGFGETGAAGAAVETKMLTVARRHGMRIVGPNCLGLFNTDPEVRFNATFAGLDPLPGAVALVSQSGAVGIVLAEEARAAGIGLSSFVSVGNKLDVSSNDLLCFFEHDPRTSVVALYLESFGNPRKFARIARRVGMHKPIVTLKAGRSTAGARGARSHTAAAATPEVAVSALLAGAGVIEVDRLEELLDVATVLVACPLPAGGRVALVGNSGGPLILAADACEGYGLSVPELGAAPQEALRRVLGPAAAVANPVDLTADGTVEHLESVLETVLADPGVDGAIVVVTALPVMSGEAARASLERFRLRCQKPVIACLLGSPRPLSAAPTSLAEVPTPERAAAALAHLRRYATWRQRPTASEPESVDFADLAEVRELVTSFLAKAPEGGWMPLDEGAGLLAAGGLSVLATIGADDAAAAERAAEAVGYPVVLKARSGELVHKSERGGVVLDLADAEAVAKAYTAMEKRLGAEMGGAVVQASMRDGVEAIVGLSSDDRFGPVVMVGLGGVATDLLGDRAFAVPPLEPGAAAAMVQRLRSAPLLDGYRGRPVVDRSALVDTVEALARLSEAVPELAEVDLNPVLVGASGAVSLDCKVRLAPRHPGPGPLFRALRER